MATSRGTKAAIAAGGLVLAVAAATALLWKPILSGYYLREFRSEPETVFAWLDAPAETARGRAVRTFLRGKAGGAVFFSEFRDVVLATVLPPGGTDALFEAFVWTTGDYVSFFQWGSTSIGRYGDLGGSNGAGSINSPHDLAARRRRLLSGFDTVAGLRFELPEYPELSFAILSRDAAFEASAAPLRREISTRLPDGVWVCHVRRVGASRIPKLVELLGDSYVTHRIDAANLLGELGARARVAIPALEAVTREEMIELFPQVDRAVRDALARIRGEDAPSHSE